MAHIGLSGEARNPIGSLADLEMIISVGSGVAQVLKDEEIIFDDDSHSRYSKKLIDFERMAIDSPDSCWKVIMDAPLWSATWQRESENRWVCIESGMGFA